MHFRNIAGGFLDFRETFLDHGDVDMLKAVRIYKEVGYDGMLCPTTYRKWTATRASSRDLRSRSATSRR